MILSNISGRTSLIASTAIWTGVEPFESIANLSAKGGLKARISARDTLCQIGRMTLPPAISLAVRPRSSYSGHFLARNAGERTTRPNRALARPSSILLLRLSPSFRENLSYQTLRPNPVSAFANGSTKLFLSSEACEINSSHSFVGGSVMHYLLSQLRLACVAALHYEPSDDMPNCTRAKGQRLPTIPMDRIQILKARVLRQER